jgi:L-alanine-DL-glutamate epimerase-like enolase superfamily enzyme
VTVRQPIRGAERLADTAAQFVSEGAERLKVVGKGDSATPDVDAVRVRAIKEAIGSDLPLAIDANYQYSITEAQELCNYLNPSDVHWFEEPVAGNDPGLLSSLRNRTQVPIAAGQNEGDRVRHRHLIEQDAVDVLLPNVCFVGGFTEATKVTGMAEAFNLEGAHGGGWPYQNMHLQAGVANGGLLELHDIVWEIAEMIYESPPTPSEGSLTLPDEPELGLTPDEDALERYLD